MASLDIELSPEERHLISEAIRTGDLDLFTNYYMQLPNSGSMWMPDDAIGHYRHLFGYEFLFDAWSQAGKPDEFDVLTREYQYHIRTVWDGLTPSFLYPHGYLFLDWVKPIIAKDNHLALVITGTGTAKTSSVAVAALTYCVLYPGFHFLNVAPSTDQATLMIDEMEKWISGTPFAKFVKPTRGGELYLKKPYPHVAIISPLNPNIESWFVCQTVGRDADNILGKNQDWISIDEVQLMTGISEALPKLMTRMRAQRSDGTPRWSKLSMLTNPGDNPELDEIRRRITAIQANPEATIKALFIEGVDSWANAQGYYDATNINTAFEDSGIFAGYVTTPVTFAVLNKRWARSTFVYLAQDGMFAWPHIERLWHEAAVYRETGEGHLSLPDDVLADSLSTMHRPCDDLDAGRAILRSTCPATSPSGTESHTRPADPA